MYARILDEIPGSINEDTINFAITAIQRCVKQVEHFRNEANNLTSKQSIALTDSLPFENSAVNDTASGRCL